MSRSEPDITFLIAAFNAEDTIGETITSALAQRDVDVEVLVVDDGSHDRTPEIAMGWPDDRVRVVALTENTGPGGARNAGLANARGRWIAVLDADDTVRPERSARMIARAEQVGAEIAVDNLEIRREGDMPHAPMFDPAHLSSLSEMTLADFIASNRLFETTFNYGYMKPIIARRFVDEHVLRYDEKLRIGEDYLFLATAMAEDGRCVIEPSAGYIYNIRAGSISRVLRIEDVEAMLAADVLFERSHELEPAARAAFRSRKRSLRHAVAFLLLVQHLKTRAPLKAIRAAMRDPMALRHLRMPIRARIERIATPLRPSRAG